MTADAWVYLHLDADGLLLYVGKTHQRQYRQRGHETSSAWWPLVAEVDHFGPYDEATALSVEAALIATHQPPHNIVGTARQIEMYRRRGASKRAHSSGRECGNAQCLVCVHRADRHCGRRRCGVCWQSRQVGAA